MKFKTEEENRQTRCSHSGENYKVQLFPISLILMKINNPRSCTPPLCEEQSAKYYMCSEKTVREAMFMMTGVKIYHIQKMNKNCQENVNYTILHVRVCWEMIMKEKLFSILMLNSVYFADLKKCNQVAIILFSNNNVF